MYTFKTQEGAVITATVAAEHVVGEDGWQASWCSRGRPPGALASMSRVAYWFAHFDSRTMIHFYRSLEFRRRDSVMRVLLRALRFVE